MIGIGSCALSAIGTGRSATETPPLAVSRFGSRVLVIAPHPDDEVIAPGGLTWEARNSGADVRAVMLTCGDGFKKAARALGKGRATPASFLSLGTMRRSECSDALAALGVPEQDRIFLGYPDAGLRALWEFDWDPAQVHLGRNGHTEVPYDFAYRRGAPYCGASVTADLSSIIADYRPTAIVYPDPNDRHPDHQAAAAFVEYALYDSGYECRRFTYVAHFGHYPFPWAYVPSLSLAAPEELLEVGTRWETLQLSREAIAKKLAALRRYASQMWIPHMNVYLRSFVRRNELFGTYAPARPLRLENDTSPPSSPDAHDVVVRQPVDTVVPAILQKGNRATEVRMAIGSNRLWLGVTVPGSSTVRRPSALHLRLLGGRTPKRFDATVRGEVVEVSTRYADSVSPTDVVVRRLGDTLWLGLPVALVEGRRVALVAGEVMGPNGRPVTTAWRPVLLR
ncbi:MAG: PIG-L family deacetylase [Coriobacteriia bacterium]|nr:PIG-L family deacetylase [Coriobacteriia bacterium]